MSHSTRQFHQRELVQEFEANVSVLLFDLKDPTTRLRDLETRLKLMAYMLPAIALTEATKNFPQVLSELRRQVKGRSGTVPVKRRDFKAVQS